MSSMESEEDGTCPICQDLFRDPKSVPCAHTFCRRCLTGHILASQKRSHPSDSFSCPLCNHVITPPDPHTHRFFWARQFPTDEKLEDAVAKMADARAAREEGAGRGGARCQSHPDKAAETWCTDHDVAVCWECAITTHKPCSGILKIPQAASQRKQEVNDMRTRLDALRDSFERELEKLDASETHLANGRMKTQNDIEEFHNRMVTLLADKKDQLRARLEEEHSAGVEGVERKRGAWRGMMEEIEETNVVAEMLFMQASEHETLTQFAPLKQQFDNLQYMLPALGTPQPTVKWVLKDPECCLEDLQALTLEEILMDTLTPSQNGATDQSPAESSTAQRRRSPQSSPSTSSGAGPSATLTSQGSLRPSSAPRSQSSSPAPGPRYTPSGAASGPSSPVASGQTRDRRSHTLHKIKRRRQKVTSSSFARVDSSSTLDKKVKKEAGSKARQVMELSAVIDTDSEGYGLGDVCLLHPRDVLLVAYLNSPALRVFFLPPPGIKSSTLDSSKKNSSILNLAKASSSTMNLAKHNSSGSGMSRSASSNDVSTSLKPTVCELTHTPCCLAQLSDDLVAATSSICPQLSLVKVSGNSARRLRAVEMGRQYRAVARAGSRSLALATYHSGDAENVIDVIQFDADFKTFTLLRSMSSHHAPVRAVGTPLFRAPHSLWVQKGGDVVVSDGDTPAVVGLSRQGKLSFLFKPDDEELLDSPAGIVGNAAGEIFVSDACTQGVLRLSSQGKPQGLVLGPESGLQSPVALALAANGAMYVADFYGGIRVFILL